MTRRNGNGDQAEGEIPLPGMPKPPEPYEPPYEELAQLAVQLRCEHCKAKGGEWCKTKSGHGATDLHAARWLVVQHVFWLGYHSGVDFVHAEERRLMSELMKDEP